MKRDYSTLDRIAFTGWPLVWLVWLHIAHDVEFAWFCVLGLCLSTLAAIVSWVGAS
jgi:hypothetical protein